MIEIMVTADGEEPRRLRFDGPQISVGRDADNDVVLESHGCSRHHAKILREGAGYRIVDLGSTNGLLFGSQVVREMPLADGLSVVVGEHRLTFSLTEQQSPDATVRMFYGSPAAIAPKPPEPTPPAPPLYLVFGSGREERPLKIVPGAEYILGRSPSADLAVDDRECSKRHALVYERGGSFHVVDLESSNGTFVNGKRVRDAPLSPGDEILIGQTPIRVQAEILDLVDRSNLLERTLRGMPAWTDDEPSAGAPRRPRSSLLLLGAAAVLAVGVGSYLAGRRLWTPPAGSPMAEAPAPAPATKLVQVAAASVRELVFDLSASGSIQAQRSVTVSAEAAARVLEQPVTEGAAVSRGALLLRLDDRDIRHQIEAARASINAEQVTLARQDYERKDRLFSDGAVVRSAVEQARSRYLTLDSTYRSTQATISQLEAQLAKTRIAAPISGMVTRLFVAEGELVGPGSPVATVENMDEVLVRMKLADRDFVRVGLSRPVEATADAFPGEVFRGEISKLGSAADPITRAFEVEARLANPGLRLRPGLIVSLRVILDHQPGLVIPTEALAEEHDGTAVVFQAHDGIARRLEVRVGRRLEREAEVLEGLSAGDEVIVVGHQDLVDGQAVETYREP